MTCTERKDLIFLLAADQLEPAEAMELRQHLATGCPICAGVLAEAQATVAQLASMLDPIEPRPLLREQLMSRISANPSGVVTSVTMSPRASETNPWRLRILAASLLSAAAAIAITSALFVQKMESDRRRPAQLQMVSMTSDIQPTARGVVAWDKDHAQWHVAVFNLAPPPPGREFELWFIPPGQGAKPIPSKTFTVDASGSATIIVPVPANVGAIAITDEPLGGVPQPTGKIQLAGKVPDLKS